MEKKVLLKDLVSTGTHIRTEFMPRAVVSDNGEYQIGEFWDANKTIDVIVNNSHKQHDNIRELDEYTHAEETRAKAAETNLANTKQDNLVSGQNIKTIAGQSILGEGNIDIQATVMANEPFPSSWRTNGTMEQLISDINADTSVVPGKIYLKTVTISDLPAGMQQAEMKVEIMGQQAGEFIMVFSVSSANTAPYKWEYSSYNESHGPWRSWVPSTVEIPTVPSNVSYFNNDAGYLTSHQDLTSIINRIEALELAAGITPPQEEEPQEEEPVE